jgi:hypothetical protein
MVVETQYFASPAIQSGLQGWICAQETSRRLLGRLYTESAFTNSLLLKQNVIFRPLLITKTIFKEEKKNKWTHT